MIQNGLSSSYLQIIPNLCLHLLVVTANHPNKCLHLLAVSRHITPRHVTHRILVGPVQTTAPRNGSINLFDAGQGNSWASHRIDPSISFLYLWGLRHATPRLAGAEARVGGWSSDSVCKSCLLLSQQIWSWMLTASQFSSGEITKADGKVASHLEFGSQRVNELCVSESDVWRNAVQCG
jgi:hypothetical protein